MLARRMVGQELQQVSPLAFVFEVVLHPVAPRGLGQVFQKARRCSAGGAVVKVKRFAQSVQAVRHGDHGCHANAPGHQPAVCGVFVQRKVVDRARHKHPAPFANGPMHERRAAAPARLGRLAQHAQHITAAVGRVACQAVGALVFGGDHHVDVPACCEGRQLAAIGRFELVTRQALGHLFTFVQHHRKHRRLGGQGLRPRSQAFGLACRQACLVLRGRKQGLVAGNAFFAVDGVSDRIGLRHFVGRVHSQGLVFVAQVQVFLQGALVGLRRLHIPARALVQLDVPPPLLDRVDAAAIEQVIEPRQRRCSGGQLHGHLSPQAVGQQAFQVPGAGFHATATHAACRVGDAVTGTFFGVALPDFVAVVHQLGASGDGPRRAFAGALVAAFAKALQAKVDGPVGGHGHVGGDAAAFQARAQKRVEDHLANAADLAQARQQEQWRLQHIAVQHRMHPGRITQPPNLLGQDAAHE